MDDVGKIIIGVVVTIIIGGTAYNVSQSDIIKNFASDTGLTQEQAEKYIKSMTEDELGSLEEIGSELITFGEEMLESAHEIDCVNYEYLWQSITLSCSDGKRQLAKTGRNYILLGEACIKVDSYQEPPKSEIEKTIQLIDQVNSDLELEANINILGRTLVNDMKKSNSYNKAILQTVLESY